MAFNSVPFTLSVFYCYIILQATSLPVEKRSMSSSTHRVVYEGDAIELQCRANGSTPPVFHWLHNGLQYEQGPLDVMSSNILAPVLVNNFPVSNHLTVANLEIRNAERHHSGKYTCVADTQTKRVTQSFMVEVRPRTQDKKPREPERVRIYQKSTDVIQDENNDIYLICRSTQGLTHPKPQTLWTIDNEPIDFQQHSNLVVHDNGDLEIKNVSEFFHWHQLTCTAYSSDGLSTDSYTPYLYISGSSTEQS